MHKWPNIVPTSCPATKPSSSLQVERKENLTNHPVKRAWLQCLLNHPVAFYALVYGSSQHLKFLHNGREVVPRAALLRLSYKTEAVKLINQALRDLHGRPIPDPVLIAILSLGAHGNESNHSAADDEASGNSTSSPQTRTTAPPNPLATAQLLNFYGALTQETAHMSALRTLLQHNNGTESITLPGLASAISLGDILNSTVTHRIPYVPHPGPLTPSVAAYLNLLPSLPLKTKSFPSGRQSAQLLESLTHSQALTAGLSSYLSLSSPPPPSPPQPQPHSVTNPTTAPPPTLEDLIISRNAVHHALLSLLPANGLWGPRFALYEALRLGMLIFSDLALFPLPAKTGVRGRYAGMLREALECILGGGGGGDAGTRCREQQQKQGEMEAQGLAWACVMGALAVEGGDGEESRRKKAWFVESARGWMEVWGVVEWEEMQTMLQRWLWCRILLEGVGKAAWEGE
ncbi:uncharacterized protein HMPREF1541_01794 [Cyphellophora europaea CBS 101466]|uniref:Transcription factor domain-containing protein n=1 Tax=Cyphellophora europaea (strain CBS 101466) TaxID=1220924 RepID=W2S1S3_CYPE1|nr:uncharacterized protein HMPREF1541_01794 [Cyphellophora europaea CBS 101466]ETN42637.1 hypothetical protein HMPREF1541_01794 [Cyphellophora europaea CBS 101466]